MMMAMKFRAVFLLLLSIFSWCRGEEQITKVTGSNVTFRASGDVQPSEITWLKNEIKIMDLEEGKEPDFYGFYNIKDRVDLNLTEKTFILRDVSPEDSGLYKAVLLVNGRITDLFFSLLVLDPVCKVSVQTMTVWHNVTLSCSCSSDGARPSQYKWRNVSHRVSDQQNLTVSMGKEPQTLWCVASNKVSSSEATVTVPRRGPDPVCKVSVQNTTVGNNVTLNCSCSSDGARPSQYKWRNVTHRVSDQQNLTVSMGKEPQTLWCVASNEVSSSEATVTVPRRRPGEEQITKVTGSSVTFRASGDVQPSEITWLKNEIKIVDLEEGKKPDFYGFYNIKDRVDLNLTEKTFILRDVSPEDSGLYKAMLLVNGRITDLFFSLLVLDPVCKVSVQTMTVWHNVTLSCSCSSDGARPSQYKWRNVSHRVSDQQNLTVSMGKEPQTLWCVASNEVSSSEATVTVPRRGPGEEQITKVTGSSVTFRASGDVQPSEITWLKNEIKIVELEEGKEPDFYGFYNIKDRVDLNLTEKTFILQDVTPEDSGMYKAVLLVNDKFQNLFFSLRVLDPVCKVSVQTMTVGHNVTLSCSCSSDGARPSQYKWRNVSHRVSDQQNLTVSMGKEPQTLWCVASNEVSSSEATVTVPRRGPDPVCKVSVQNMTVGHNVTLSCSCSSDGARPSQYKWRNVTHRVSDQQNLTVSMGKEPQTLWCVASNEVSSSEATVTVPRREPEEEKKMGAQGSHHIIIAVSAITIVIIVLITALCYYKNRPCHVRSVTATRHRKELQMGKDVPPTSSVPDNGACGGSYTVRSDTE
ncbi:basement membrane-specific heparan sulfate proteoglycan core protein-like [Ranitomeya imitator]|uniref:basement membrane-specific heparan sulfate proteoglycan core protein-like n=1 Tax=Ranitomeya imitator TaxID=111125 RepID=UPI0037E81FC9